MLTVLNDKMILTPWNGRGPGNDIKCGRVSPQVNPLKADILFLQAAHTIKATEYKLKPSWISQVYHAPFTPRARGVSPRLRIQMGDLFRFLVIFVNFRSFS